MPIRLKDIAAELGVSAVTVSKVLRNQGRFSSGTRERVLQRIKELNYQPNLTARSLVSGRTFLIGLIVPDLMHPFFAAIAKSISRTLRAQGYGVAISSSEEDPEVERQEISMFMARRVDALILASSQRSDGGAILKSMEEQRVPFVLLDRMIPGLKAPFVGSDDKAIGVLATEHLIERGYRRIAHIRVPRISTGNNRFRGYLTAMKHHGLVAPMELTAIAQSADERGEQCGFEAMRQLLALQPRPDAVFCFNDIIAFGALKAIQEAGLRVPSDVAVIGVANLSALSFWDSAQVSLSTVDQNIPAIADLTAKMVLELVDKGPRSRQERVFLPPNLVVRSST